MEIIIEIAAFAYGLFIIISCFLYALELSDNPYKDGYIGRSILIIVMFTLPGVYIVFSDGIGFSASNKAASILNMICVLYACIACSHLVWTRIKKKNPQQELSIPTLILMIFIFVITFVAAIKINQLNNN